MKTNKQLLWEVFWGVLIAVVFCAVVRACLLHSNIPTATVTATPSFPEIKNQKVEYLSPEEKEAITHTLIEGKPVPDINLITKVRVVDVGMYIEYSDGRKILTTNFTMYTGFKEIPK